MNNKENIISNYLKVITKNDVNMINRWTSHADVPINELLKFALKIKNIEPVVNLTVYRGIGTNLSYQEKMGLFEKKFLMHFLIKGVREGYKFTYSTPRPLSFTEDIKTAKSFGNVIVSSIFSKRTKYIRITEAFWEAVNRIDTSSLFNEVILLDINKEIEYNVFQINLF